MKAFLALLCYFLAIFFMRGMCPTEAQFPLLHSLFSWPFAILGAIAIYAVCGVQIIDEWDRRPVYRFGRYVDTIGPGLCWVEPFLHTVGNDINVYDTVWTLSSGVTQSKDNVPISFEFALTWKIFSDRVREFIVNVGDGDDAIQQRAIAVVGELAASWPLDDLLHKRQEFGKKAVDLLIPRLESWGMTVKAIEIKRFSIEHAEIENALALKAKAQREGEAEVARAEKQVQVAQALEAAAECYENPRAMQLRGLEALAELARSGENNMVLIPTDLLTVFTKIAPTKSDDKENATV